MVVSTNTAETFYCFPITRYQLISRKRNTIPFSHFIEFVVIISPVVIKVSSKECIFASVKNAMLENMMFIYDFSDANATAVIEKYQTRFSHQITPSKKVFARVFNNFYQTERLASYKRNVECASRPKLEGDILDLEPEPETSSRGVVRRQLIL